MGKDTSWGTRLSQILREKKVTQKKAAQIAGVAASVMSGWLSGVSPTDLKAVKRLCDELEVNFTWLLTGESDRDANITISELFDETPYFDGYARIRIDRLTKRTKKGGDK